MADPRPELGLAVHRLHLTSWAARTRRTNPECPERQHGIRPWTLRHWVSDRKIDVVKYENGIVRIRRSVLDRYVAGCTIKARTSHERRTKESRDKDLAVLKAFFNWCMLHNLATSNPVRRVKFFNEDNSRLRYLTEDEYNRLLLAAKNIETSRFLAKKIILSVHTGLRRGSLFHLRWDHVDFLNRVLRIPRTKSGPPTRCR